jgi:membrane fusion protein, multidrug efflux system
MKNISLFSSFLVLVFLLNSCGEEKKSKLDDLLEKKRKLRAELAEVQNQINAIGLNVSGVVEPLVSISPIENKTFVHKIKVQGNVETDQDVLLNAELGGLITQVHVKEGQSVSVGQVLVSLDAAMISSNMQELETQLEYAKYLMEKQEELKKRGVGSEFEYKSAKSQVDALKSKMKSLGTQRGKSTVKAPFSGVIDKVYARNGQMAGPQGPLLRLVNNKEINITADISEKHFENIKKGTAVKVTFPNYKDTSLNLTITQIGNYIDPTNRTFRLMSNLKNNKVFLPNMLAELEITDMNEANSIVIPAKSILKTQNNEDYVYIAQKAENGKYKAKKVMIELIEKYEGEASIQFKDYTFKKGEFVIVDGARGIGENDLVRTK